MCFVENISFLFFRFLCSPSLLDFFTFFLEKSPRNMYQCQMAKQSMATPMQSYVYRTDNKIYRLLNPQKPLVRTVAQHKYSMNDYPTGKFILSL
jgi:DNA-directed RNA polymerase I subunit RPA2